MIFRTFIVLSFFVVGQVFANETASTHSKEKDSKTAQTDQKQTTRIPAKTRADVSRK